MHDFPTAVLLVGTAFLAALIGNWLVLALAKAQRDKSSEGQHHVSADRTGIVFFFDGPDLVDCTAEAMRVLKSSETGKTGAFSVLIAALGPRFPDLDSALRDLGDVGTVTLLSSQNAAGDAEPVALVATRHGGLTRIQLHDGTRENRSLWVDPITWRLLNEELDILRQITFRMNGPAWVEDATGQVIWANPAYLSLLRNKGNEDCNLPWPLPSLFATRPGQVDSTRHDPGVPHRMSLQVAGRALWFELRNTVSASGGRTCFADPIDALQQCEATLRAFVQTLSKTFSQLPTGLAVFDRNRALHMFNPALAQLTGLSVEFLASRPRLSAVLDALREANRLPEPKNYQTWRHELIEMERAAVSGVYEEVWNLPDGVTYRVTGRPHPDGAIALLIEDITPEMQRSQRYLKEMALGRSVIDAIAEPVVVFNSAGERVMENTAFAAFGWAGDRPIQTDGPLAAEGTSARAHIRSLAESLPIRTASTPFWRQLQEYVMTIGDREPWAAPVRLADGRHFEVQVQPLVGSATMLIFRAAAAAAPKAQVADAPKGRLQA